MGISQATILQVYGELTGVALKLDHYAQMAQRLWADEEQAPVEDTFLRYIQEMAQAAEKAQRTALAALLAEDPTIKADPLTGEIE